MNRPARTVIRILFEVVAVTLVAIPLLLILLQNRLIYYPRPYLEIELRSIPTGMLRIPYDTAAGQQVAYYLPPKERRAAPVERIWMVFPGNAMLALDWLSVLDDAPLPGHGFLLFDYPGYGESAGTPSPRTIEESLRAAYAALRKTLGEVSPAPKLGVLGLSLGAAAGLQWATHEPVDKIVLIAPFATMLEEARRTVGTPLCYLLRHRFDNVARLSDLAGRSPRPHVWIFHGTEDITIPPTRSDSLKAIYPEMVTLRQVDGADHNTTLHAVEQEIFAAMRD